MKVTLMNCLACKSANIKKNGHIHNGKQNYMCRHCGRQFVADNKKTITTEQREQIKKLLLERISLRGICRVMNVSLTWLLAFFGLVTSEIPEDMGIIKPKKSKLTIELDEMWSFVGSKENKQWIWLAIDRATKQIGFHIGGEEKKMPKNYGHPFHLFIVNVRFVTLIFGMPTKR